MTRTSILPTILGLVGSGVLFLGTFMPVVTLPMVGRQSYMQFGQAPAAVVAAVAIMGAILAILNKPLFQWITGIAALGTTIFTYFSTKATFAKLRAEVERQLLDFEILYPGTEDTLLTAYTRSIADVKMEWGWSVLIAGGVILCASALASTVVSQPRNSTFRIEMPRA